VFFSRRNSLALAFLTSVFVALRGATTPNKSLDASGGSVFRIMTGPAMLE